MACLLSVSHLKSTLYSFIPFPCEGKQYYFSHCTHEENTNMWDSNPQPMLLTSHHPIRNKIKSEITIMQKEGEIKLSGGSNIFQVAGLSLVAQII